MKRLSLKREKPAAVGYSVNFIFLFKIVVPFVVRSPVSNLDEPIKNNKLFEDKLDEFMRKTPLF